MAPSTARLFTISFSPWSEKARWALDSCRVPYREVEYVPMLSEPGLRWRTGRWRGRMTVPTLLNGREAIMGSIEIARHADRTGTPSLQFATESEQITRWDALSDRMLAASRVFVTQRSRRSRAAQSEALPTTIPHPLRGVLAPIALTGISFIQSKYRDEGPATLRDAESTLRLGLEELRAALSDGRRYLLGTFSHADVAMAAALQGVWPVADEHLRIGPATREVWSQPEIAAAFQDLVDWRDALYAGHRRS